MKTRNLLGHEIPTSVSESNYSEKNSLKAIFLILLATTFLAAGIFCTIISIQKGFVFDMLLTSYFTILFTLDMGKILILNLTKYENIVWRDRASLLNDLLFRVSLPYLIPGILLIMGLIAMLHYVFPKWDGIAELHSIFNNKKNAKKN